MKVIYGYDVQEHGDYYVDLAEDAVNMFSLVTTPGLFFVDVFPWRKFPLLYHGYLCLH